MPRADYGVDAPYVVRNLSLMGAALLVLGIVAVRSGHQLERWLGIFLLVGCGIGLLEGGYMLWSSRVGKYRERERLLDLVALRGDEHVLDVGCGRGLILNGAALRLTTGRAVGLDLWGGRDQSGNTPEATTDNARREGVLERVELVHGDAREMPLAIATFDVVLSSLAVHNIPAARERRTALREILRVLRPGGRFAILDFQRTGEYASALRELGAADVRIIGPHYLMFPPVRIVMGRKPLDYCP
jgi:SAM-dependent methyltransferase